ncbi:MAG: YchF-related putative GTPase, partial [Candidatus Micrarchaeota archaeon]
MLMKPGFLTVNAAADLPNNAPVFIPKFCNPAHAKGIKAPGARKECSIIMLIAIVGLPNKGKSTLFNALTRANAAVANYPFTTINPNKGVAFASAPCPHLRIGKPCDPHNAPCEAGVRKIPANVVDVAGLVEGAHEGRGMGNQFLSDIAGADCIIAVADASGGTDGEGNPCAPGSHDAVADVEVLFKELDYWLAGVLAKNAAKAKGKGLDFFASQLSGIKIGLVELKAACRKAEISEEKFSDWTKQERLNVATQLRTARPTLIAANKIDSEHAAKNIEALKAEFPMPVMPVAADAEVALLKAAEKKWIEYDGKGFKIIGENLDQRIIDALRRIDEHVLKRYGSTGVAALAGECVFTLMGQIVAYPVEDEVHYCNHFGKVLPDAVLLQKGSTALQMAGRIHTDLAKGFLYAVDAET